MRENTSVTPYAYILEENIKSCLVLEMHKKILPVDLTLFGLNHHIKRETCLSNQTVRILKENRRETS